MAKTAGRPKGTKENLPRSFIIDQAKIGPDDAWRVGGLYGFPGNYYQSFQTQRVAHHIKIKMLEHPLIKAALMLCQSLIGNVTWWFELKKNQEIADYCTELLKPHWHNLVDGVIQAKCFGFAPFEKILEIRTWPGKGEAIFYKELKFLDPSTVVMWVDENGRYAGFSQPSLNVDKRIKPEKTFWLVHNPKWALIVSGHNPYYGHPDMDQGTYIHWYNNYIVWQMFLRYVNRKVNPPTIAFSPNDYIRFKKSDGTSGEGWMIDFVHKAIQQLSEGSTAVFPFIESDKSGKNKIDVKLLEGEKRVSEFAQVLDLTGQQLFYSVLVPSSIFEKPKSTTGSYAMISAQVDIFLAYLTGSLLPEAQIQIKRQLIEPVVALQFGKNAPVPDFELSLPTEGVRQVLSDSLKLAIKEGKCVPDVEEISRRLGTPKPLKVDPEGSSKRNKGGDHEGRTGGAEDPTRTGEEIGR